MSTWYYLNDGQQKGPITFEELQRVGQTGGLSAKDSLVWEEGMPDWVPPSTVDGLTLIAAPPTDPYAAPSSGPVGHAPATVGTALAEIEPGSETIVVGAVLGKAWHTFKKYSGLCIGVGVISIGIQMALAVALQIVMMILFAGTAAASGTTESGEIAAAGIAMTVVLFIGFYFLMLGAQLFLMLGLVKFGLNALADSNPSINDLFSQGRKILPTVGASIVLYLGAALLTLPGIGIIAATVGFSSEPNGLLVSLAFLLIYIPMIWLMLRCMHFIPCIVEEDCGPIESLKRSWALTKNNVFAMFLLGLLAVLITMAGMLALMIGLIVAMPVAYLMWFAAYRWLRFGHRSCEIN